MQFTGFYGFHLLQYCEKVLIFVIGKMYDVLSFDSQEPDATVFLSSTTEPKIGMYLNDFAFFLYVLNTYFYFLVWSFLVSNKLFC